MESNFIKDYCRLQNMSYESGLLVATQACVIALPKLSKVSTILKGKDELGQLKELPIEVGLGDEFKYHNIFFCPVSKEVAGKDNPPMLLTCGHVIAKNSMQKMMRQARQNIRCPTCPTEMT